jgi:ABC-type amino acid transport substrate-binding protein
MRAPALRQAALRLFCAAFLTAGVQAGTDDGNPPEPSQGPALVVCVLPASMPRTDRSPNGTARGLDVAVAQAVGRALGRTVEFHWCASAACSWHCLPEKRCHLVAGQPSGSGPSHGIAWSVPYVGAQFGLVVSDKSAAVRSLADLRGKRVGVVSGTVALSEADQAIVRFPSREALLESFKSARLDAAFLDADFAAWYLHEHTQLSLHLVRDYVPRERWNMALAVRASDGNLLVDVNRALAQLAQSGEIREIYARVGIPFRDPFTGSSSRQLFSSSNTWRRIHDRGELVVSMDPANLPYSSARPDRPGIDLEVARALAQELRAKLRVEWLDVHHETAVGELLQNRCDLVVGEAVAANRVADDEELADKILYSRPYYGSGYLLVQRASGPHARSLEELKGSKALRLGTEAGSLADYSLRRSGYLRRLYRNQLAALKAVSDGDIDFAYLWANVGWTLHVSPELKLELSPGYVPEEHWNIAIAMRHGDEELKRNVDVAIGQLISKGAIQRILSRYHMSPFPPFDGPIQKSQGRLDEPLHEVMANRGPEPQMQRIQGSKAPYSALARIRSAGELTAGLDQHNLPFSTAHPAPAGLDYEVAVLLAKQLGVRLRVYWAYSSHDSYTSRLTAKQLCDVILGVIPDDRFGHRVLYTHPYYVAQYKFVVRTGKSLPDSSEPVAVEEGVAVRGLEGRTVQRFSSTEAILDAVATGQIKSGYVISTRGGWLAGERWPGKLRFLEPADPGDRLPITAAVRKADRDLKDAIDQVWDDLDRSGRLAEVFTRWHIPFKSNASSEARR